MPRHRGQFKPGQSGNPKGRRPGTKETKARLPRSFRRIAAEVVAEHPDDIQRALLRGIRDRRQAHRYLTIFAGLEKHYIEHSGDALMPKPVIFELHTK